MRQLCVLQWEQIKTKNPSPTRALGAVAVSGFLPGGGEFFLEISSGGGDNLPGGGEKIAL